MSRDVPNDRPDAAINPERTPAGIQARRSIVVRRIVVFTATATLTIGVLAWLSMILSPGGIGLLDALLLLSTIAPAAWIVFLFVNAIVAFYLFMFRSDPTQATTPVARGSEGTEELSLRTAILMTVRNEDPARVFSRLVAIRENLQTTTSSAQFDVFVLSDTDQPEIAATEEELFQRLRPQLAGDAAAYYRRRDGNEGFKAGNIRDFVDHRGEDYDLMLCLDADSVMSGAAIGAHAMIMQRHPKLGLLQSLIFPAAGETLFTRLLRFGSQCTVRTHYLGHAWWQADAGPFGGHNAFVRVAPFKTHCRLPQIAARPPLGGPVLGHDHVEAAMLSAAGYEVRLLPEPTESWEDHPATAAEFALRDQRWGRCNMQYAYLLGLPELTGMNRFHLAHLFTLFLVPPAVLFCALLATLKTVDSDAPEIDSGEAGLFFLTLLALSLAPKLVGYVDAVRSQGGAAVFGGWAAYLFSTVLEIVFTVLQAPAILFLTGMSIIALWLGFEKRNGSVWMAPARDADGLSWPQAWRVFWPPTVFGAGTTLFLAAFAPAALPWFAPGLLGLIFAAPFAVVTGSRKLGLALRRSGLLLIPAETRPHEILERVKRTTLA
ncbi:MAG: glucans biosynthesis glucosyltransferase MdoH [Pseudomonadota bacterium]